MRFNKLLDNHAIILYKTDLAAIEQALRELLPDGKFTIQIGFDDAEVSAESVNELLQNRIPKSCQYIELGISLHGVNSTVSKWISYRANHSYSNVIIHSSEEGWFLSAQKRVKQLLKELRPWYWPLKTYIGVCIVGAISSLLAYYAIQVMNKARVEGGGLYTAIGITLIGTAVLASYAVLSQRLLPFVKVYFSDRNKFNYERASFAVSLIMVLLTILSIIVPLATK